MITLESVTTRCVILGSVAALGIASGCDLVAPQSAGADVSAAEAVQDATDTHEAISAVRDRYRSVPSAGSAAAGDARGPRAVMPVPPAYRMRPRLPDGGVPEGSGYFAALFDGNAPTDRIPDEYVMPEDVYWSFAVLLEQGRAGEAFDLLDEPTRRAVREPLLHALKGGGADPSLAGERLSTVPTRELWIALLDGAAPGQLEILAVRTAMNSREAEVILTPRRGQEQPIRFVLGPEGWRMNLQRFLATSPAP